MKRAGILSSMMTVLVLTSLSVPGDAALSIWTRQYNGPGNTSDEARAMAVSPLGTSVFVAGGSWGPLGNGYDYATVAYDSLNGNELWTARYDGPIHGMDQAWAMGVSPNGSRVYVTGEVVTGFTPGGYPLTDAGTIAYDATTGNQLWVALYDGPEHSGDAAVALAVGPEGRRVYVSGSSHGHALVIAYDARTGKRLWAMRYDEADTTGSSYAPALAADKAGRVYAAGYDDGVVGYSDLLIFSLDGKNGALRWEARHHGEVLSNYDRATAIAVDPAGSRVFATGGDLASGDQLGPDPDMVTIAYDASTGAQEWVSHAPEPGAEGRALVASPDGLSVYATGVFQPGVVGGQNYGTIAYDAASGIARWTREYHGGIGSDEPTAIAVAPNGGRVYVTGQSEGFQTGSDYATVVYSAATGTQLTVRGYVGPGLDRPTAIGVHPLLPGVYVTGWLVNASADGGNNFATVGYVDIP